jgi:hypothetical protein
MTGKEATHKTQKELFGRCLQLSLEKKLFFLLGRVALILYVGFQVFALHFDCAAKAEAWQLPTP